MRAAPGRSVPGIAGDPSARQTTAFMPSNISHHEKFSCVYWDHPLHPRHDIGEEKAAIKDCEMAGHGGEAL